MLDLCRLIWRMFTDLFRSRATLEAEILVLRQQINVLRRRVPRKLAFNPIDRLIFIGLYRLFPQTCRALAIVKPDTDGGVWLGANPKLPDPGPRWRLRRDIHPPGSIHRYSRSSDVSSLTLANAYAERLIGSIRRECIDHIVIFGERHLRHVLLSYMTYYNDARTHLSLNKDAPVPRAADTAGRIICQPILGGLHHQYTRI